MELVTGYADNQKGKQFDHARIADGGRCQQGAARTTRGEVLGGLWRGTAVPQVSEKAFEDYHLYTLPAATTIHDRETKQVEFLHAEGIQSKASMSRRRWLTEYNVYNDVRNIQQYGTQSNRMPVVREFQQRRESSGGCCPRAACGFTGGTRTQVEFTGRTIDHTSDETVRVHGQWFDITYERQTKFQSQLQPGGWADESFEPAAQSQERGSDGACGGTSLPGPTGRSQESAQHPQVDSRTVEYEVTLAPDEERRHLFRTTRGEKA